MDNFNKQVHIREFMPFALIVIGGYIFYKLYVGDFSFIEAFLLFLALCFVVKIIEEKLLFILYPLTEDEKQRLNNMIAENEEKLRQANLLSNDVNNDEYKDNANSYSSSSSNNKRSNTSSDDSYDSYYTLREEDYSQEYGDDYEDAIQDGWEEKKRRRK